MHLGIMDWKPSCVASERMRSSHLLCEEAVRCAQAGPRGGPSSLRKVRAESLFPNSNPALLTPSPQEAAPAPCPQVQPQASAQAPPFASNPRGSVPQSLSPCPSTIPPAALFAGPGPQGPPTTTSNKHRGVLPSTGRWAPQTGHHHLRFPARHKVLGPNCPPAGSWPWRGGAGPL